MDEKIKIMHLTLSMGYGGLERIINQFAKKMDKDKFEISISCLDSGGPFLDDLSKNGLKKFVFTRKPGILDISLLLKLISLFKREKIDIIHSHSGCSFYAAISGRLAGVKRIIHTDHGRLIPDKMGLILEDKIASILLNAYVAVSYELSNYLQYRVKINKDKIITIINGVDTDCFKPFPEVEKKDVKKEIGVLEDAEIIGTVCRLDPVKNLIFMIETVKDILKKREKTILLIVGEGPERKHIEDVVDKLELNKKIILLGKRNDVEKIMPILDIFVLPSISEGTSMTILEAMSCGIPVIASTVGGNPAIVSEGRNGFLFPLDSPEVLTNRVLELLIDKEKRKAMGKEARKIVEERFSFNGMLRKYTDMYINLALSR